jgi:transposase InsO family protein
MTRQNYYKRRRVLTARAVDEQLVLDLVGRERGRQPRLGARKLLHVLGPEWKTAGVAMGRDRFLGLLRRHDLLVPHRARLARTTWSGHGFRVYPNLAKDLELKAPHQLLVADITYIRTREGFLYLSLMMDGFSRAVVGFDCSDSLEVEGALRTLRMAQRQLPAGSQTVHHSDRGIQYCCGAYVEALGSLRASMTEQNHCYENGQAERLNGILKGEYGLGETFARKALVPPAVRESVKLYNWHRPHMALGYRTPMAVHGGTPE